jgi:Icc-related predicted phosphoesterase
MKFQLLSDVHANFLGQKPITIVDGVDAVVIAGDVDEGALNSFDWIRKLVPREVRVVMVMGNHEYYRKVLPLELELARKAAPDFGIDLLENSVAVIKGIKDTEAVRFVGATLWTNYRLFGDHNAALAMRAAADGMSDHRLIRWSKSPWRRFRPQEALMMHTGSVAYIMRELKTDFPGPSVLVTHHPMHVRSLTNVSESLLAAAYCSDLETLLLECQPSIAVHGHVHTNSDYYVGGTRIICNPRGHPGENEKFDPALVVEVTS